MAALPRYGRSLRANELPSGAQDISEASVIPEMREREVGSRKEKKSRRRYWKRRRRAQGRKVKRRRGRIAPSRIALDERADAE